MADAITAIAQQARKAHARWDEATWRALVEGPARELAARMQASGAEDAATLCTSYLRLGAEGIGLGYLYPETLGENVFGRAWRRLLPQQLATIDPARRAGTLAACWNLAENLEQGPGWLGRIFLRVIGDDTDIGALPTVVAEVSRQLDAPSQILPATACLTPERARVSRVHLGASDTRFLPGALHFLAPTVACVHARGGGDGLRDSTLGVWLRDEPLVLGPMGCPDTPVAQVDDGLDTAITRIDPRLREVHAAARNDWRAGITLVTSQFLLSLAPR